MLWLVIVSLSLLGLGVATLVITVHVITEATMCVHCTLMSFVFAYLDLDLDNNCQSPDGYFGNGVCTPTGMM